MTVMSTCDGSLAHSPRSAHTPHRHPPDGRNLQLCDYDRETVQVVNYSRNRITSKRLLHLSPSILQGIMAAGHASRYKTGLRSEHKIPVLPNGSALPRLYQSDGHSRAIRATDDTDRQAMLPVSKSK